MEIAKRIKAARLEAGLSQKALCGDVVTRNMLSLIESGKARPSMETLRHFARVLGKPLSYFLDEDAVVSSNQKRMAQAEIAYARKNFSGVLSVLEDYEVPDPIFDNAYYLLRYSACLQLAQKAVKEEKKVYAAALLEQAEAARVNTIYAPGAEAINQLRYQLFPELAASLRLPVTEQLLIHAEAALLENAPEKALRFLLAAPEEPPRWHLLRGKTAFLLKDFGVARGHLTAAEDDYPKEAIPLLEQAYLALEDYKMAYEYAKKAQQ